MDIPQSLYKAMKQHLFGSHGTPHLVCGHAVRLEMWLPMFQGVTDKVFRNIRHVSVSEVIISGRVTLNVLGRG